MKTTLRRFEVSELVSVIKGLGGRVEQVTDHDGKHVGLVEKPFDFDIKATIAMAKTARMLAGEVEDYTSAQRAIQNKVRVDADGKPLSEEAKAIEVETELRAFMLGTVEVELHRFNAEALKVNTNKLSSRVIAALLPMLTGPLVEDATVKD